MVAFSMSISEVKKMIELYFTVKLITLVVFLILATVGLVKIWRDYH